MSHFILIRPHTTTRLYFYDYGTINDSITAMISYFCEIKKIDHEVYIAKTDDNYFIHEKYYMNNEGKIINSIGEFPFTLSYYQQKQINELFSEKKQNVNNTKELINTKKIKNEIIQQITPQEKPTIKNESVDDIILRHRTESLEKEKKIKEDMEKAYDITQKRKKEEKKKEQHNIFLNDKEIYEKILIGEIKCIPTLFKEKKCAFDVLFELNDSNNEEKYWELIDKETKELDDDEIFTNDFSLKNVTIDENKSIIDDTIFEDISTNPTTEDIKILNDTFIVNNQINNLPTIENTKILENPMTTQH
jgi:hypothetical protein